jgi:hypothetical protein
MVVNKPEKCETIMMTIGEYAGNNIDQIPSYYLKWVAENWDEDSAFKRRFVEACDKEWQWREDNNCHISKDDFNGERAAKGLKGK